MSVTFTSFYQTNNADFEKWKNSVDKGKFSGALLKISQRHLDCLDHELLTAKLNACGFSLPELRFMTTYQTENKGQRFMIIIVLGQKYYLAFRKGQFLNFGE